MSDETNIIDDVYEHVPGMILKTLGKWFHEKARDCMSPIVEIGSCAGLSSICLGLGSRDGHRVTVYCVDPFNGGGATPEEGYVNVGVSLPQWQDNISRYGLQDICKPIAEYSENAHKKYSGGPISLLFIDGDHTYKYVKMDIELWTPHLKKDGILLLHDAGFPGVQQATEELIADNPGWRKQDFYWIKR